MLEVGAGGSPRARRFAPTQPARDGGERAYHRSVSVAVSLEELARRVEDFGPVAFLVTTDGATSHVVSVAVGFDGAELSAPVGRSSQRNIEATAIATLLWPGRDGGPYSLIVDGAARTDGDLARVRPTTAVLHRLADAPADLPSCVRIEDQAD